MIILGLHFGHDASVSIIKDGKVLICLEVERITRVKHAIGLKYEDIEKALIDCKISIDEIDYATITSTQLIETVFIDDEKLSFKLGCLSDEHKKYAGVIYNKMNIDPQEFSSRGMGFIENIFKHNIDHHYNKSLPDSFRDSFLKKSFAKSFEKFIDFELWDKVKNLNSIADMDYSNIFNEDICQGFHYPAILNISGKKIPAFVFSHHYSHICYSFYESPFEESAIISNDGAGGGYLKYLSGFFGYGYKNKVYPFTPNNLNAGELYDHSAIALGFDGSGGAGKLMGLSAYGKPKFFSSKFVGNWFDISCISPDVWINHCKDEAVLQGYDISDFGNLDKILSPVNVDFAASTQKLIEEIMLLATQSLKSSLKNSKKYTNNLCLSGGIALNCPANTRIYNESGFQDLFVPPAISDMGLSIGSALALYYNILGFERIIEKESPKQAYLGLNSSADLKNIENDLESFRGKIKITKNTDISKSIAQDLNDNKVIVIFYGRSEVGPRALCHRSIISNPKYKENWERVNVIKGRELWRPFAPIVLQGYEEEYFADCPFPSYFMLFNARVKNGDIPAVTHVDGTARIQSINSECGLIHDVLQEYKKMGNIPILMNTSFNGPGQPIIETASEACDFLVQRKIDAIYFDKFKIEKI